MEGGIFDGFSLECSFISAGRNFTVIVNCCSCTVLTISMIAR